MFDVSLIDDVSYDVVFRLVASRHVIIPVLVRGLKVNEGVTGPNAVLFLHRSTRKKKCTLSFNFYPVTKDLVFELFWKRKSKNY